MKILATALIILGLVGCASTRQQSQVMTYEQLSAIRVSNYDCGDIDTVVKNMENQLRIKGLLNANPEDLSDGDRKYNASARIIIWSMRIGCNNPRRYKS